LRELSAPGDVIVVGAPLHNFATPAPLKAWIHQIVRAGQTVLFAAERSFMGILLFQPSWMPPLRL